MVRTREPASFWRDSRRHSTKGSSENVIVTGKSNQILNFIILLSREDFFFFSKVKSRPPSRLFHRNLKS